MIRKIRLRGHVIHIYGTKDMTRFEPKTCIECRSRFDDRGHRKCEYLCCEFQECLNCVLHKTKFPCPVFKKLEKEAKERLRVEKETESCTKSTGSLSESKLD